MLNTDLKKISDNKSDTAGLITAYGRKRKKISKTSRAYQEIVPKIQKRNGAIVSFDFDHIAGAIYKAMIASGGACGA
jgi:hypothetical protein